MPKIQSFLSLTDSVASEELQSILKDDAIAILGAKEDENPDTSYPMFWQRVLARTIDYLITSSLSLAIIFIFLTISLYNLSDAAREKFIFECSPNNNIESLKTIPSCQEIFTHVEPTLNFVLIFTSILTIIYFLVCPLTKFQATIGKLIIGIKIVDMNNNKISLLQSFTREIYFTIYSILFFGSYFNLKFVSMLQVISFCIIVYSCLRVNWSSNNQALHDEIAQTLVIRADKSLKTQ